MAFVLDSLAAHWQKSQIGPIFSNATAYATLHGASLYDRISKSNITESFGPIGSDVTEALNHTKSAGLAWSTVGYKLLVLIGRFLMENPEFLVIIGVVLVLYILTRFLGRLFQRFRTWTHTKYLNAKAVFDAYLRRLGDRSRWLAALLPHVLYLVLFLGACYFPSARDMLSNQNIAFIVGIVVPGLFSLAALLPLDEDDDDGNFDRTKIDAAVKNMKVNCLTYWAVLGILFTIAEIPILRNFLPMIPFYNLLQTAVVLWLVAPFIEAPQTIQSLYLTLAFRISPLLSKSSAKVAETTPFISVVARMFLSANIVDKIAQFLAGAHILLLAVPFFFSPRFILHFGCALVGVFVPAHISLSLNDFSASYVEDVTRWLQYWVIFVIFHGVHELLEVRLEALPFWYDAEMVALLWLQLPYFKGAAKMASTFVNSDMVQATLTPLTPARSILASRRASRAAQPVDPTPLRPKGNPAASSKLRNMTSAEQRSTTDTTVVEEQPQATSSTIAQKAKED
eukprot:TRINITY_DN5284_c0_g1_i1.p1 TRINITY_DN5284_c0_g1~~TRINITY_DN5284_c0_g1_i1.p1  ORF type:complete len:519 (+),score=71.84 TRINITY_DN5284_c0_g1_i1:29-1558(+)